jgi:hypothetical protein
LFSGSGAIDLEYIEFYTNAKNRSKLGFGILTDVGDQVTVLGIMILLQ